MGDYFANTPHVYLPAASQEQAKTRGNSMFLDEQYKSVYERRHGQ